MKLRIESLIEKSKAEWPRFISLLTEEICKKRLAVFVGAGCSMSLGLPSWTQLLDDLISKYNIKTNERDVFRLASRLERAIGPLKLRENIVERLRIDEIKKSELHDALVNLDTNLFITTNYDTLLEDYFKLKGVSPCIIGNPKDIPAIDPTRKTIVKLHGDLNSPSSLVITAEDYRKYKDEDKGFVDWLNSIAVSNSILFAGASFDDPRLKDVDDYVLNSFGSKRRQPFIFFKIPGQVQGKGDEDFAAVLDDFEALCDDFRGRGFYLFLVEKYEEIAGILKEVKEKTLQEKLKTEPGDIGAQLNLKDFQLGKLEKDMTHLIDEKIQELVKKVLGEGRPPGINKIKKGREKLIDILNNPPYRLGPESRVYGLFCVAETFLITAETKADIINARQYYEKAVEALQESKDRSKFQERSIRLRAKLLFEEGEVDDAIASLAKSRDPKTISFWLMYLIEAKRIDEAYEFIEKNEINPQWVSEALQIYIIKGEITVAEQLFRKTLEEFELEKEKGNLEDTQYKGDFFFDHICFAMIHSIFNKAIDQAGRKNLKKVNPFDFSEDARPVLRKSLEFIDLFFKERQVANLEDDYRVIQILLIEMGVCQILGLIDRADKAAKKLSMVESIDKKVVGYLIIRGEAFPERKSILKVILRNLYKYSLTYPDQAWAWSTIAKIESDFEQIENSWSALKKAVTLVKENEKNELLTLLTVGYELNKLYDALILVKNSMNFNEEEACFWEGYCYWLEGKTKEAFEKINKINELNFSIELRAFILSIKGQWEIENQNWVEARKLLDESVRQFQNPAALRSLLFVLVKLEDEVEVLRVAEKFDSFGMRDEQVTFIEAQVLRNLRQFEKSEELWLELNKKYPGKPDYAFGLAQVLFHSDKEAEAKKVLTSFIQPGDNFDMNCFKLALEIYSLSYENEKAFSLLEKCWQEIQEQSDLVWKHVELAFKIGKEKEAQKSLQRMGQLQEEGKVTKMFFLKSDNPEELINLVKRRMTAVDGVLEQYKAGEIPRIKLCEILGTTLYLDWAVRTQPLAEDFFKLNEVTDFIIYSTDGFSLVQEGKSVQFASIEAPKEAAEIVIDYHALITIHRLGFIEKLCRRYQKIYYPEVFKSLWKVEQSRYSQFQWSRVKAFQKLNERLDKQEIRKVPAPIKESRVDRYLSLARIEKVPLIDNYIKKEELSGYPDVPVIRLWQLVDWLFEKGRISESFWQEVKKHSGGEAALEIENWKKIMDDSLRFVVDSMTLELMEVLDINQKLIDMGVVLFVEEYTADFIHNRIRNLKFEKVVAEWHKHLVQEITGNSNFVKVNPDYNKNKNEKVERIKENPYWESVYAPLKYCLDNNFFLLTDDRWTQKIFPRHFGTDALLKDLFENEIIDIQEYTEAFLKLCQWRYRFLLPDIRILIFIAEQYKKNLPGKDLEFIAAYLRQNVEDPGLSTAPEPAIQPSRIAGKYFLKIIDIWLKFLAEIWQKKETFGEENLDEITDWFYLYAFPDLPKVIHGEIRGRMYGLLSHILSISLFSIIIASENHKRLFGFLSKILENTFETYEKREDALINIIRYIKNHEFPLVPKTKKLKNPQIEIKKYFLVKLLETFFGKDLIEARIELGNSPKLAAEVSDLIPLEFDMEQEEIKNSIKILANYFQKRKDIHGYNRITPLIIAEQGPTDVSVVSLHELIKHPAVEIKKNGLKLIDEADFITDLTKRKIDKLKQKMISSKAPYRQLASEKAAELLLKDFQYAKSIINEMKEKQFKEWPKEPISAILKPDLSTVIWKPPLLIKENLDKKRITNKIKEEINRSFDLNAFLDWFLDECFFVPLDQPLNPWRFFEGFLRKRKIPNKDALCILKNWIDENPNPMAYLMAFEIVLSIRSTVASGKSERENCEFRNEDFIPFLNQLFEALLMQKSEDTSSDKALFENMKERWHFKVVLSRYCLEYIDLNLSESKDDEYKVVLAWWMARGIEKTLIENFSMLSLEQQTLWLKKNFSYINSELSVSFEHYVRYREKEFSRGRYYTAFKLKSISTSALALAIIYPQKHQKAAFRGINEPTNALGLWITDEIIRQLPLEIMRGEGQILTIPKGRVPFLWDLPLCISAPAFLRTFYSDDLSFLGKENVWLIEFTEVISNPDFLKNNLPNLPDSIEDKKYWEVLFVFSSLDAFVNFHGKMPPEAVIFKEHKELLKKVMQSFDSPFGSFCIMRGILSLNKLISVGNSEWVEVFRNQLKDIDYVKFAEELSQMQIDLIEEHILRIVTMGFDISILEPIIQRKRTNKAIREILGRIKFFIELNIAHVPIENRENLRKFLNQISDVPAISEKTEKEKPGIKVKEETL